MPSLRSSIVPVEHRVRPLELFFDLVFVFAFTEVTALMHADETWGGLLRGVVALAVLWWAWSAYAWLTNAFDAESGLVVATMLVGAGAMFLAALALPDAFTTHRMFFAASFVVVLAMFAVLYTAAAKLDPDLAALVRALPWTAVGAALIIVAALVGGDVMPVVWLAAVAAGTVGPALGTVPSWRVHPEHFAERHALIVLIAIGESMIAVGSGARAAGLDESIVAAVILGLVVAASFWLAYFHFAAAGMQHLLARAHGAERALLARDVYSYLHFPMIAGIVLFAFGLEVTIAHVDATLHTIPALALCLGSALYLLAFVLVRRRVIGPLGGVRAVAAAAFVILFPVSLVVPALAALALCTAIWVALNTYEIVRWRGAAFDPDADLPGTDRASS